MDIENIIDPKNNSVEPTYEIFKQVGKRYILYVKILGKGQYATTYLARNLEAKRTLACKVISKENIIQQLRHIESREAAEQRKTQILQRLQNEVDNTRKMSHPNVISFEDLIESKSNIYIFMEYCPNGTLEKLLQKRKLSESEAIPLMIELTQGCKYLYTLGVIHRDLKPSNILFSSDGKTKIVDFGFSKALSDEVKDCSQYQTSWIGTPLYMSPQIMGQSPYSIKTDVWSLGCIFYELLYGVQPWYSDDIKILTQMIKGEQVKFPNTPEVSQKIKILIKNMLVKEEQERYTIDDVAKEFNLI